MRAFHVPAAGQTPTLGELPRPVPAEGTVLVRVHAAGLNPLDNLVASGAMASMVPHEYPLVLGRDAAGTVEAVGDGVDHVAVGDRVYGHQLLAPPLQAGTLADYAVLPAASVQRVPDGLDLTLAAALPLASAAASAAVSALDDAVGAGDLVLVNGASGGVGGFVVQLLGQRGLEVVATGSAEDAARLLALGASATVDFTAGPVVDQVLAAYPGRVDALINLAGHTADQIPLGAVKPGGVVAFTTMGPDQESLDAAGLVGRKVMAQAVREVTEPIARQVADGTIQVAVTELPGLERAAEGLAALASGTVSGKVVVVL